MPRPWSRAPRAIRILGVVLIILELITPHFGLERFRTVLDWWSARGTLFKRVWAGLALGFGLSLAYAGAP